mmetsp:Transcript_33655/g.49481  ORF Transcript_33655/g.49481 Transcript_33655/m.49481 type:complete len:120 (+) Transcript_33655:271-630(+)
MTHLKEELVSEKQMVEVFQGLFDVVWEKEEIKLVEICEKNAEKCEEENEQERTQFLPPQQMATKPTYSDIVRGKNLTNPIINSENNVHKEEAKSSLPVTKGVKNSLPVTKLTSQNAQKY